MPLFTVKTSNKIDTSMRLEESTAKMLDRYAHFHKGSADDVVNESLEYIFKNTTENFSNTSPRTLRRKLRHRYA